MCGCGGVGCGGAAGPDLMLQPKREHEAGGVVRACMPVCGHLDVTRHVSLASPKRNEQLTNAARSGTGWGGSCETSISQHSSAQMQRRGVVLAKCGLQARSPSGHLRAAAQWQRIMLGRACDEWAPIFGGAADRGSAKQDVAQASRNWRWQDHGLTLLCAAWRVWARRRVGRHAAC